MENIDNKDINKPEPIKKKDRHQETPNNPKKGRALHKWSLFFFVLTCIGTALAGAMLILPFFLVIAGAISVLAWLIVIVFMSIFTLFLIWTSEEAKEFIHNWRLFNESLIDSSKNVQDFANKLIPTMLITGGAFILITWLFLIIGISTDVVRKKKYLGKIIALIVITLIYVVFLFINLKNYNFL